MSYYKLVRDKIPEIIEAKGINSISHIADNEEYESALMDKLKEEVAEFIEDPCKEEMADIMEVIYAILKQKQFSFNDIEVVRKKKTKERGAFEKKVIAFIK
ncbi:nucleoside triphosphate pyrophosphohydrolase [Candidatus Parcubacteria bacterium]|nr:nucleoside triphosphate pyrophosphohydrolase [Candidatus Parcubacteria bacterium]